MGVLTTMRPHTTLSMLNAYWKVNIEDVSKGCNLSKILSLKRSTPLSINYSKGGTHVTTPKGRNFHIDLIYA
jgi:hypothetical protein